VQRSPSHDAPQEVASIQSAPAGPHSSIAILVALFSLVACLVHEAETAVPARVAVHFSPNGGATEAVVREVHAAKTQVLVQAYSFTSVPIAKALVDAHKRGVKVLAVLDKSNETEIAGCKFFVASIGLRSWRRPPPSASVPCKST
jgi:phosphatidylserine/phosphatidylglycerophosphate/cardiolipin synthase-like enzyme